MMRCLSATDACYHEAFCWRNALRSMIEFLEDAHALQMFDEVVLQQFNYSYIISLSAGTTERQVLPLQHGVLQWRMECEW